MRVLIDTHVLIWYLEGNSKLSPKARQLIDSRQDQVFLSIVSLWEMTIKIGMDKLQLGRPFDELEGVLGRMNISVLPIAFADMKEYLKLPLHHRDPFDRLLIAQALVETIPVLSKDAIFSNYRELNCIW